MSKIIRRLQSNGYSLYVYLPRRLTRELSLKPGDLLLIEQANGGILLKPVEIHEKRAPVKRKGKAAWPPVVAPTPTGGPPGGGSQDGKREARI